MKTRRVALAFLFCLLAASVAAAAPWEVGVTYYAGEADGLAGNWADGTALRIGVMLEQRARVEFHAIAEVAYYRYTGDDLFFMVPDILGYRFDVDGHATHAYGACAVIRHHGWGPHPVRQSGYVWLEVGVSVIDVGEIVFTDWIEGDPGSRDSRLIGDSGDVCWSSHLGVGAGLPLLLSDGLRVALELGVRASSYRGGPEFPLSVVLSF